MLLMQGIQILSLIGELRSHTPCGAAKRKKRIGSLVKFHLIKKDLMLKKEFPGGIVGKEPACQCRRHKRCGSIPGS